MQFLSFFKKKKKKNYIENYVLEFRKNYKLGKGNIRTLYFTKTFILGSSNGNTSISTIC